MLTLLDTHAWIWWVTEDRRLSKRAKSAIDKAQKDGPLLLSAISIWEIAKKVSLKRLKLGKPVPEWIAEALAYPGIRLIGLTPDIAIEANQLPGTFHRDPADHLSWI